MPPYYSEKKLKRENERWRLLQQEILRYLKDHAQGCREEEIIDGITYYASSEGRDAINGLIRNGSVRKDEKGRFFLARADEEIKDGGWLERERSRLHVKRDYLPE